jgi:archaellin
MLFSDIQFRLAGGDILSPKNIQISQTSAFQINRNVRPLFMNDRIFFCVKRGGNTSVQEYFVSESASSKSEANDITAHCQTYIPDDVTKLSGSAVNNMLFLISKSSPDALFVYKYYDSGNERMQSAWFKWTFNGNLHNAFAFGSEINLMIDRIQSIAVEDWVMSTGIWEGSKLWKGDELWIGSPSELTSLNQFEQMEISPLDFLTTTYIDDNREEEDKTIIDGFSIDGNYASGEVLSRENFSIILNNDTEFVFNQTVTAGSLTYTVHRDDGTTYTAITTDDTPVTIPVPKNLAFKIFKITVTPEYGATTTAKVNPPEAYNIDTPDVNILQHLNTYGWYVDTVSMPSDVLIDNQGAWFKIYGVSNVGALIPTRIDLGEWVLDTGGKKETRGHLQFKTAQISSEEGSEFSLEVRDISRDRIKKIQSKYTVNRKPMIYGNANHMRLGIISTSEVGFRINTLSYEGNFNIRSRRM